ncbi:MAG: hypothetical protein Q9218_000217 [Villophora microphyllina]
MSFDRRSPHSIEPTNAAATALNVNPTSPDSLSTTAPSQQYTHHWATRIPEGYVIPTKLQAQGGFQIPKNSINLSTAAYRGVYGTAATIWKEEGVRGMYRGLGPMLLGYVPTWAVYLTVYNKTQAYFRTKTETDGAGRSDNWFLANVYASLSGGACSTMATNPIWVIKTRLMAQSNTTAAVKHSRPPWQYRNTLDAARKMYSAEGLLSFYSGLTPALLGLTHVAIQFPLYEVFKEKFTGIGAGMAETEEDRSHHFYGLALAVFLSKVCASTATYPHEVVRTRLQTQQRSSTDAFSSAVTSRRTNKDHGRPPGTGSSKSLNILPYRGTVQTCQTIFLEEGWRGFYAGLGTNLIRAVPSAMTTILTFEYLKKAINSIRREEQDWIDVAGQPAT